MTAMRAAGERPWYREPWPWILMAGPAAAVVAGLFTLWLAFATADPSIAGDYDLLDVCRPETVEWRPQ